MVWVSLHTHTGMTVSSPSNLEASSAVCLWKCMCLELEPHVTVQFNSRHRDIPGISRPLNSVVNDIQTLSSFSLHVRQDLHDMTLENG